jgi:hypothetical protein
LHVVHIRNNHIVISEEHVDTRHDTCSEHIELSVEFSFGVLTYDLKSADYRVLDEPLCLKSHRTWVYKKKSHHFWGIRWSFYPVVSRRRGLDVIVLQDVGPYISH